jgi:hypothetical protein
MNDPVRQLKPDGWSGYGGERADDEPRRRADADELPGFSRMGGNRVGHPAEHVRSPLRLISTLVVVGGDVARGARSAFSALRRPLDGQRGTSAARPACPTGRQ